MTSDNQVSTDSDVKYCTVKNLVLDQISTGKAPLDNMPCKKSIEFVSPIFTQQIQSDKDHSTNSTWWSSKEYVGACGVNADTKHIFLVRQWSHLPQGHGVPKVDPGPFIKDSNTNTRLTIQRNCQNGIACNRLHWKLYVGVEDLLITKHGDLAIVIDSCDEAAAVKIINLKQSITTWFMLEKEKKKAINFWLTVD